MLFRMKKHVFFFLTMFVGGSLVSAQTVSFGVKGGVPLVDQTETSSESRPYIIGPSGEVHLFGGFAVEVDALYQRLGTSAVFSFSSGLPIRYNAVRERGNAWEFPVLGKYYFRSRAAAWRPYLATGYNFRTIGLHEAVTEIAPAQNGTSHISTRSALGIGATFAAGVRFRAGRIALLPEVRYTRWGSSDNLTRKNEAGFLLGINF
jgi:hypothetical protein